MLKFCKQFQNKYDKTIGKLLYYLAQFKWDIHTTQWPKKLSNNPKLMPYPTTPFSDRYTQRSLGYMLFSIIYIVYQN